MANFKLEDYEPVEERIKKFYKDFPTGRILTEIHSDDGKAIIIKASIYQDYSLDVWATGFAEEVRGEGFVNKTSAVENCETSAIGRALANANYAGSKRPSREEMEKASRPQPIAQTPTPINSDAITEAQRRKIFVMMREGGIDTEDHQRAMVKEITGKDSTADLTRQEASQVIEALS